MLLPLEGHHAQGGRLRAQWQAKMPLMKQTWKQIVIAKITMQAAALEAMGELHAPVAMLKRREAKGDSTRIGSQSARYY